MDPEDEGWVKIPYDELLEVNDGGDEKNFSRKYIKSPSKLVKPNYFDTPRNSKDFTEDEVKEIIKLPILIKESKEIRSNQEHGFDQDQDQNFQAFFKKENQFVEMKMGSLESDMSNIETYEEKSGDHVVNCSSPTKMIKQDLVAWEKSNQELNFWKWGLSGIGAFCSFGMAAATICIIVLGNGRRHKQQNRKLNIQIYSDNKSIKKVVQQANEAMSAVRGVPLVKAQITYGGYYESI